MQGRNSALIRRYFPGYRSPKEAYAKMLDRVVRPGGVWLDIGCGRQLSGDPELNEELCRRAGLVVGCDRDPHLKRHATIRALVLCDAAALPFKSGTFDVVSASMVAEHLADPESAFKEVARVSRAGAAFVLFTPNRFNYAMLVARLTPHWFHLFYKRLSFFLNRGEWRGFEDDVFPTWYRANTIKQLRRLMAAANLQEEEVKRLALAHSFGFVRPLYVLSLLFERLIDRPPLDVLKADLLAVFRKPASAQTSAHNGNGHSRLNVDGTDRRQEAIDNEGADVLASEMAP